METRTFADEHNVGLDAVQNDGILTVMLRLFEILTNALDTVRKARSGASVGVKAAVEAVRTSNPEAATAAAGIGNELRQIIFSALQEIPEASLLIPEVLADISEEVRDVRKLVLANLDVEDETEDDVDTSEALAQANFAKELLNNYSTLLGMLGHNLAELPEKMVRKNKAGELALSLPKVPSMESEGTKSTGAGRPVSGGKFKFTLNGEPVNVSGFDRLAVFYCSTLTDRINGSDLKSAIKRQTGKEWSDKGNEKFTVTVPAGTLSAELVEQS